jgi:murein DD-endopeptidase MepM/ murein hydrolase activator NlpD
MRVPRTLLLAAACLLPILGSTPAVADDLTQLQQQQQQDQSRANADQARINQDKARQADLQAQLNVLDGQIAQTQKSLADQNARLDQILGSIDDTRTRLAAKEDELARRQDLLRQRSRSLYKEDGNQSLLASVFAATSFSELLDRFMFMRDVTHEDQLLVSQLEEDRRAIQQLEASLEQQRHDQQAVVSSIAAQEQALQQQYVQDAALKHQLGLDQAQRQQDEAQALASESSVAGQIAALLEARRHAHSSGVFAWPGVQGPITQGFGCTDLAGEPPPPSGYHCPPSAPRFHYGIDIAGPYGAEIDAADGGTAYTYPCCSSGYGNYVIVIHANGFATVYGHMSRFAIASGTAVGKGQAIGYEGSTGYSTGPHLHFEVRLNDVAQNPCQYVGC